MRQRTYHHLELPLDSRVEVVLDRVVSSTRQIFSDLRPLVSKLSMRLYDQVIFLFSPFFLLYMRIQMIMPSLPALLADAAWQMLCDL